MMRSFRPIQLALSASLFCACQTTTSSLPLKTTKVPTAKVEKQSPRHLASPSAYALYLQASLALEENQIQDALGLFTEAYYYEPDRAYLSYQIASLFFQLGDLDQTREFLMQALQQEPALSEAKVLFARLLAAEGNLEEAISQFQMLLPTLELPFLADYLLLLYSDHRTLQLQEQLSQLGTASDNFAPTLFLAQVLVEQAPDLSRQLFESAYAAAPRQEDVLLGYQDFLYLQQELEAAAKLVQRAIADETASSALLFAALRHVSKEQEEQALPWVEALATLGLPEAQEQEDCYNLAADLSNAGLPTLAQALYRLLLSLDPSNEELQKLSRKVILKRSP